MLRTFSKELLVSCKALALCLLLAGLIYPMLVTALGHALFPRQASGSLTVTDGECLGSALIGQPFAAPGYIHGRPSATQLLPYNAAASGGSNLGPLNPALLAAIADRVAAFRTENHVPDENPVPVDMVTASASGLDPHISPAGAMAQVDRVAGSRKLPPEVVRELVERLTEPRFCGIFGEPRVNVFKMNLALDAQSESR